MKRVKLYNDVSPAEIMAVLSDTERVFHISISYRKFGRISSVPHLFIVTQSGGQAVLVARHFQEERRARNEVSLFSGWAIDDIRRFLGQCTRWTQLLQRTKDLGHITDLVSALAEAGWLEKVGSYNPAQQQLF